MTSRDLLEQRSSPAPSWPLCFHSVASRLSAPIVAIIFVSALAGSAAGQTQFVPARMMPSLRAWDLMLLKERVGSPKPVKESLQLTRPLGFGGTDFGAGKIVAFEENRFFLYAVGASPAADSRTPGTRRAEGWPQLVRRLIFLKPSTFVIDDQVRASRSPGNIRWSLYSSAMPLVAADGQVRAAVRQGELVCETLLPKAVRRMKTQENWEKKRVSHYRIDVVPEGNPVQVRFVHLLHIRKRGSEEFPTHSAATQKEGQVELTVSSDERVFQLTLITGGAGADEIAVSEADGEVLLARRLLPAGILPYGPEGTRLIERWDAAYRGDRRPGWDTGRPSSELKKAVEDGTLRPCRAVVLGCGLGTNAVYLAGKGFDVTAIDIAPTALARAKERAREAGVEVCWLLADVLAPPGLEPFDLIYDRGCYHGVRRQNAAGYVEAVRRLSHPGTRLLLLAGNANEPRHYGPPRIKEEELRGDFSSLFEFEWLRETRFDSRDPAGKGALAWSILLRRKQEP